MHVAREVLDDPLVEALVASAQQRQRGLAGQLVDERVVEQRARRARARSPAAARAARRGRCRSGRAARVDHVDAQDHAGAAAERRVVDLPAAQRRVVAEVDRSSGSCRRRARCATWRWARNHSNHSGNSVTTSISTSALALVGAWTALRDQLAEEAHVDLDPPRRATSTSRIASLHQRHQQRRRPPCWRRPRGLARGQREQAPTVPSSRSPSNTARPRARGPPLALAERRASRALDLERLPRSASAPSRSSMPVQTDDRARVGAGAAHDLGAAPPTVTLVAEHEQARPGSCHIEAPIEAVRAPDTPAWSLRAGSATVLSA